MPQLVSVSLTLLFNLSIGLTVTACGSSSSSSPDAEPITGSQVTGTIGALGPAQPIVSSLYIENSGETLIYLSSDTLTCEQLTVSRWLGGTAAGTQVVELVFEGTAAPGDIQLPPGEVNYAPGGMSSAHELGAASGTITFTSVQDQAAVAGSFHASLGSNDTITGVFHATFCANGQGY